MQSQSGKLLCSKTALKRCTSTEHLWKRKVVSQTSPEHWEIFLPRSERSWQADELYTPKVSIAMGSNKYRPSTLEYLSSSRLAANSAAEPVSRAAPATYELANGQVTVTSQHSALLLLLLFITLNVSHSEKNYCDRMSFMSPTGITRWPSSFL